MSNYTISTELVDNNNSAIVSQAPLYSISVDIVQSSISSSVVQNDLNYTLNVVNVIYTTPPQKAITSGTTPPTGGVDGDIYLQYLP